MYKFAIVLAFLSAGCTDILGNYDVERLPVIGDDGHCTSDEQCREHFHPASFCRDPGSDEAICIARVPASDASDQ